MDRFPLLFKWQWNLGKNPKRISTPVSVSPPDESFSAASEEHVDAHAIWDTGAAQTYVTPEVESEVELAVCWDAACWRDNGRPKNQSGAFGFLYRA